MTQRITSIVIGIFIVAFAIVVPWLAIPKIGISWDESFQRHYGDVIIEWVVHKDPQLYQDTERYYGPLIPTLLHIPESLGWTQDTVSIYELRHWITWLIFLTGIPFVILISRRAGLSRLQSMITGSIVATTPLIATHGLFNSKDIPFMSICTIITWLFLRYLDTPVLKRSVVLGIGFGLAILCRANAISVIAVLMAVGLILWRPSIRHVANLIVTALIATLITYFGWPTLWINPWTEFKTAFITMANYPWTGSVLFNGELISAQQLPWIYIPVWMGITLSPLFILGFLSSALYGITTVKKWIQKPNYVLCLLGSISLLPVIIGIITQTPFYDGWRHLFFIYPGIVILTMAGLCFVSQRVSWGPWAVSVFGVLYALNTAWTWIEYFPYAHCYLNSFAGQRESIIYNWEMDYWGVSYRELLSSITPTQILPDNLPASTNIDLLPRQKRSQFTVVDRPENATLFITNHRLRRGPLPYPREAEVIRDGFPLSTAYRLP